MWTDLLGAEVRWIDAGGVRTRVVSAGAHGPPLVLLHGRGGHLETWHRNTSAWAGTHRVVAADLLGHGCTEAAGSEYGVAELLDHATALIDTVLAESGEKRATVVGQSLGGWVAAWWSRRRPEQARRLVLVEPAGLQAEAERLADPRVAAAYEHGGEAFKQVTTETVRLRLRQLMDDESTVDDEMVELRRRLYAADGATAVHRAVRRADNSRWLLTPEWWLEHRVPTLFIRGENAHVPAAVVERAAANSSPVGQVYTVPAAKQWPHYENPAVVNTEVARFLNGGTS
ncbi:alpha/beta fold hydrolase [Phytoactinopolyspora limicola]|uniref:alpha/beta fold hydrolase n=1 Tax=Phytoactinopolyspora limicola TaxID=2715536 RepID=UPI001FE44579|nr:alpha/beta hydrolase [Phytoactinopolyspora limicola]